MPSRIRRPDLVDEALKRAAAAEAADPEATLPFAVTILVLGLSGAGKSATINSLLGHEASPISSTGTGTKKVSAEPGCSPLPPLPAMPHPHPILHGGFFGMEGCDTSNFAKFRCNPLPARCYILHAMTRQFCILGVLDTATVMHLRLI